MHMNQNLTADRQTFVTHLECSITGERYEADQLHGLSRAGRPLVVRYDLDAVRSAISRDTIEARPTDLWRWRELLPVRHTSNIVSLGEIETPLVPLTKSGGPNVLVKDEGRLPTGSFKARGLVMAVAMAKELGVTKIAMPTNGNAGAALAAYATRCGIETIVFCPDDTPEINVREIAMQGARVWRVNGLIDDCGAIVGKGAAEGRWFDFSTLKEPYRIEGKKTMGLELAAQFGWKLPDAIFYPNRRRYRADRDVEGVRRTRTARLDWPRAPQDVRGAGKRLRADRSRIRGGRGACRTLGRREHRCGRHSRAEGGWRLPDPPRSAGVGRAGTRGRRSRDPEGGRRRGEAGRLAAMPGGRRDAGGVSSGAEHRAGRRGRQGRTFQLRDRTEISDARSTASA
jgi:hypothetical protein